MSLIVDITRDVCPMTTAKVGMALASLAQEATLEIRLTETALTNVIAAVKAHGHRVAAVGRSGEYFMLLVKRGSASDALADTAEAVAAAEEVRS